MPPSATAASQSSLSAICSPSMTSPLLVSMLVAGWTTSFGGGGAAQAVVVAATAAATVTAAARRTVRRVNRVMSGHILGSEAAGENGEDPDDDDVEQAQLGGLLEGTVVIGIEDRDGQQA